MRQESLPADSRKIASSHYELGYTQRLNGSPQAAKAHQTQALTIHQMREPGVTPRAIRIHRELFVCLLNEKDLALAEEHLQAATQMTQRLYGYYHKDVALNLKSLGNLQVDRGHYEGAILSYFESEALHRAMLGEKHLSLAGIQHNLGEAFRYSQEWDKAEEHFRQAVAINQEGKANQPNVNLGFHLLSLGATLVRQGNFQEAEQALCEANDMFLKFSANPSRETSLVLVYLAEIHLARGELASAQSMIRAAQSFLEPRDHLEIAIAQRILAL